MKKISVLVLLILISSLLSSCGTLQSNSTSTKEIVTITFLRGKDYNDVTRNIIKQFENENPDIRVNLIEKPVSVDEQHNMHVTMLSGEDFSIDVFWVDNIFIPEYASKGYIESLESRFKSFREYLPQAVESSKYNGILYAVPIEMDMGLLYYRRDLVQSMPDSWEQIESKATELEKSGKIENGFALQNDDGEDLVCSILEYAWSSNKDISQGLDMYKRMFGGRAVHTVSKYPNEWLQDFKDGRVAFLRTWNSKRKFVTDEFSKVRGKVGVGYLPADPKGGITSGVLKNYSLVMNKNSQYKDEAWRFIEYLCSVNAQKEQAVMGGLLPTIPSLYTDDKVVEYNPHFKELSGIFKQMNQRQLTVDYAKESSIFHDNILEFLQGKVTSAQVEDYVNKYLNGYGYKK